MTGEVRRAMFLAGVRAVAGRRRGGSSLEDIAEGLDHLQHGTDRERLQYDGVAAAVCHFDGKTTIADVLCRKEGVEAEEFAAALAGVEA